MDIFIQQIINGLVLGSMYALVALGYTMVYGVLNLINFAHGDVLMIGAMVALTILKFVQIYLPGLARHRQTDDRHSRRDSGLHGRQRHHRTGRLSPLRNAPRLAPLITAIGVSILLQTFAMMIWGRSPIPFPASDAERTDRTSAARVISPTQVMLLVLAALSMVGLVLLVEKTKMGRAMRATAENPRVAGLMGVDSNRVIVADLRHRRGAGGGGRRDVGRQLFVGAICDGLRARPESIFRRGAGRHRQYLRRHAGRHPARPDRKSGRRLYRRPDRRFPRQSLPGHLCLRRADHRAHPAAVRHHGRARGRSRIRRNIMARLFRRQKQSAQSLYQHGVVHRLLLVLFPFIAAQFGNSWVRIMDFALLYIMLALGLNIVVGFAGLLDLGYIAFYALGAYMTGLLASPQFAVVLESFVNQYPAIGNALMSDLRPGNCAERHPFVGLADRAAGGRVGRPVRRAARRADAEAARRLPGHRHARVSAKSSASS